MRYVNELREGEMVSEIYLCKSKQSLKTKAGKSYYSLILQDKTGTLDGKIWDLTSGIDHFEEMNYIKVEGQVTQYQGVNQLNIRRVRVAMEGEYVPSDYMPCTDKDVSKMYQDLLALIGKVENTYLKKLLQMFFVDDVEFLEKFKNHSAAKKVHHGFIGGLLEHTLSVTKLCEFYSMQYPVLNKDLLLTAAMFHDIGKVKELSAFPENDYTDEGQLLGHIIIGTMMLDEKIRQIPNFPKTLENELKHCILAHHGEYEYGSPKKPAIVEALALNMADNTDAKMQTFKELLQGDKENEVWLGFQRLFDSNMRKTTV